MDWAGAAFSLMAWVSIGRKLRTGFILAIIGNTLTATAALQAHVWGIAAYCCTVSMIQLYSWYHWEHPNAGIS